MGWGTCISSDAFEERCSGRRSSEEASPWATTFFDGWRGPCPGTQRASTGFGETERHGHLGRAAALFVLGDEMHRKKRRCLAPNHNCLLDKALTTHKRFYVFFMKVFFFCTASPALCFSLHFSCCLVCPIALCAMGRLEMVLVVLLWTAYSVIPAPRDRGT
jgi:hypothetical protein